MNNQYSLKNFLPLIVIISIIFIFTLFSQWYFGFNFMNSMIDFMAGFFIVFGIFKIINLNDFATAYQEYDLIAKRSTIYAYAYPFIELALGVSYLFRFHLRVVNWITLILMIISSTGVAIELAKKREIVCACLGTVFKIPMTYVTLAEDLIMGLMALIMLIL